MPFLNIFSKSKSRRRKEILKPKIIIDYREKNSLVASELVSLGFEIEFVELKIGDYIVKDVVIERKTISDFLSSMINKRLFNQLEEIKQYPNKLLIIEGIEEQELYNDNPNSKLLKASENFENLEKELKNQENTQHGINPNAIRGFLLSILLKHKVPIIFTKNYSDTAKFISVLSRKKQKELPLNISKKSLNKKERMQFILEGFPGIGPKTAKKLLKKFKSLKNIFNASQEELKEILGKKAEIIKKIIENKY